MEYPQAEYAVTKFIGFIIVSYFHLVSMASCYITGHASENTLLSSKEHLAFWVNLSCLVSYIIFVRSNLTPDPTLSATCNALCFISVISFCNAREHN